MNTETLTATPAANQPELIEPLKPRTAHAAFLDPATTALLRARTNDPLVRALVLSKCNVWLPAGDLTFEAAIEYLETNYTPPPPILASAPFPAPNTIALAVDVFESAIECGTARYTVRVEGSATINIPAQTLQDIAEDCQDADDLVCRVRDYINDTADERITLEPCEGEDYNYQRHECDEITERDFDFNMSDARFREAVLDALRTTNPELLAELVDEEEG